MQIKRYKYCEWKEFFDRVIVPSSRILMLSLGNIPWPRAADTPQWRNREKSTRMSTKGRGGLSPRVERGEAEVAASSKRVSTSRGKTRILRNRILVKGQAPSRAASLGTRYSRAATWSATAERSRTSLRNASLRLHDGETMRDSRHQANSWLSFGDGPEIITRW